MSSKAKTRWLTVGVAATGSSDPQTWETALGWLTGQYAGAAGLTLGAVEGWETPLGSAITLPEGAARERADEGRGGAVGWDGWLVAGCACAWPLSSREDAEGGRADLQARASALAACPRPRLRSRLRRWSGADPIVATEVDGWQGRG